MTQTNIKALELFNLWFNISAPTEPDLFLA